MENVLDTVCVCVCEGGYKNATFTEQKRASKTAKHYDKSSFLFYLPMAEMEARAL